MRYRLFGRSGLRVSEVILGAMTFADDHFDARRHADRQESQRIFDAYVEAGGRTIDTANRYTEGDSERIVGELVAHDRDAFVLSSKYTITNDPTDANASGNHRKNLRRSLEQTLRRLQTDHVDILWVHIWDPSTPIDETIRALEDVVREGKALYLGISDAPAWVVSRANTIAELRGWTRFEGLQLPYSLLQREIERELLPMADAFDLTVTAWSPLGSGVLSGKFLDGDAGATRVDASTISERDTAITRELVAVAQDLGCTPSQAAIAWVRQRSPRMVPILGAKTLAQLTDTLASLDVTIPDDAMARLDEASAIELGFPSDMIGRLDTFVHGEVGALVDPRP
ncbi:MAG: aldo/keto reductase [Actinomycetia bacterium]|nr:aldo/keto reductase [Actinomycetes bacterium]